MSVNPQDRLIHDRLIDFNIEFILFVEVTKG